MALWIQRPEGHGLRIYERQLFPIRWINDELSHAGMPSFILSKALLMSGLHVTARGKNKIEK